MMYVLQLACNILRAKVAATMIDLVWHTAEAYNNCIT